MNAVRRFFNDAKLCFLVACFPHKIEEMEAREYERQVAIEQNKTNEEREREIQQGVERQRRRHLVVRSAFFLSFLIVIVAGFFGWIGGLVMGYAFCCASTLVVNLLQIVGTGILLWATLFVRGWDIQTIGGESTAERVNRWLYRNLCFIGTLLLVVGLSWPSCT